MSDEYWKSGNIKAPPTKIENTLSRAAQKVMAYTGQPTLSNALELERRHAALRTKLEALVKRFDIAATRGYNDTLIGEAFRECAEDVREALKEEP